MKRVCLTSNEPNTRIRSWGGSISYIKSPKLAEANNHHPDIMIQYKRISVRYWTHTTSGVTLADVQMAQKVDALF